MLAVASAFAAGCGGGSTTGPITVANFDPTTATTPAPTATSATDTPATPPPATAGDDEDGCDSFDAYDDEVVVGVPFDSVASQVRSMIDGLRLSDEVHAPTARDAPGATWRVIRASAVVAEVEFVRSGNGWIPSRGEACGGLTFRP